MIPTWGRASQDHNDPPRQLPDPPKDDANNHRRRSSSDSTPRPTPSVPRPLPSSNSMEPTHSSGNSVDHPTSTSRRLGFFGERDKPSSSSTTAQRSGLLHPHSHSHVRADSGLAPPSTSAASTISALSSASTATLVKTHSSPSKTRTYDAKVVTREMQRLGSTSTSPSTTTLTTPNPRSDSLMAASSATLVSVLSGDSHPWGSLHVHLLPLFNGEPLRIPIEDLNTLVKRHIQVVLESPSKVVAALDNDASELIAAGMVTLNSKLVGVEEAKLLARLVEIWAFFWEQVLPYVEGVLLPLQNDPILRSLYRTPKPHRTAASPTGHSPMGSLPSSLNTSYHIDVRTVALRSFRDRIVLPLYSRLLSRISNKQDPSLEAVLPRLQQMLLVLSSQASSVSVLVPGERPPKGESAITDLLRILKSPRNPAQRQRQSMLNSQRMSKLPAAPTFLSGGAPRDRRGRIALKKGMDKNSTRAGGDGGEMDADTEGDGGETPKIGAFGKSRQLLDSLRSPPPPAGDVRMSMGGWGLGHGLEDAAKASEEEDEDGTSNWDEAQATVERMVGMISMSSLK